MEFRIEAESRLPSIRKKIPRKKTPILLGLLGLMSLFPASCAHECKPLAGSPAFPSMDITNKQDMTRFMEMHSKMLWNISFINDYPLEITYQGQTIKFIADGVDVTNKIAYEFIGLKDYYSNMNPDEVISPDEIDLIHNSKFGVYYISIFRAPSSELAGECFYSTMYQFERDGKELISGTNSH